MSKTNSNPKTAKHTPGPWTINPPATCNATFPRTVHHLQFEEPLGQRNQICVMVDASFESDANARLIAAAPSLLADLEAAQKREQVLREAVKRAVPWMNKFINDDRHIETVSPSDCLASRQMLLDALAATEVK